MPEAEPKLTLSKNTKTTPLIRERNDGRASYYPKFANSFGLPAMKSCPGKTDFCDQYCYAVISEGRTNVSIAMNNNFEILKNLDEDEMYDVLSDMMEDYRTNVEKTKIPPEDDVFRIHWDGDFFSVDYAKAWARVIGENPQTYFWVYTRSFRQPVNVVPILHDISNLSFYLSVDEGNFDDAMIVREEYPKIRMAFCAKDQYRAEKLAERAGKSKEAMKACPENIGKIALALNGHGACIECRLCIEKKRPNILFVDSEIYDLEAQQKIFDSLEPEQPALVPVAFISRKENSTLENPVQTSFDNVEIHDQLFILTK